MSVTVGRLEERELELKKEFNSLHQRHTEVRVGGTNNKQQTKNKNKTKMVIEFYSSSSADDP